MNIQLSSRETDKKVLAIFALVVISAIAGFLLQPPLDDPEIRSLDALITLALGGFSWGIFHLGEPTRRHYPKWTKIKEIGIPVIWLLLVLIFAVWFHDVRAEDEDLHQQKTIMSA